MNCDETFHEIFLDPTASPATLVRRHPGLLQPNIFGHFQLPVGNLNCFRIKAKAKLYFEEGGSGSASEESLTDAVAKENIL